MELCVMLRRRNPKCFCEVLVDMDIILFGYYYYYYFYSDSESRNKLCTVWPPGVLSLISLISLFFFLSLSLFHVALWPAFLL